MKKYDLSWPPRHGTEPTSHAMARFVGPTGLRTVGVGVGPLNTVPIVSIDISRKVQGLAGAAAPVVRAVQKGLGIGIANHEMNSHLSRRTGYPPRSDVLGRAADR